MGVLAAIVFFCFLLFIGLIGIIAGIIGLILFGKLRKDGKVKTKIPSVIFAIVLSVGCLVTLIPVGFFSFIMIVNSVPPEGFVDTGIVIEEDGYQDISFTADGVVYEALDLQIYDNDAITDPVFTYRTSGFLNGSQCGNYYAIENTPGFDLVSDEYGLLFAPVDEKDEIIAYYTDQSNLWGNYDDWDGREFKLSSDDDKALREFLKIDTEELPRKKITLQNAEEFEIKLLCSDGLVYVDSYWFVLLNDTLYYVCESDFAEDDGIVYTLARLPEEIADGLLAIHEK